MNIQYNTIQYNTIQYNTIQYNTIQWPKEKWKEKPWSTKHYNRKLEIDQLEFHIKLGVNSGAPKVQAVPAPQVIPVVTVLSKLWW